MIRLSMCGYLVTKALGIAGVAVSLATSVASAQTPPPTIVEAPGRAVVGTPTIVTAPAVAIPDDAQVDPAEPVESGLPENVQVVRFQAPAGTLIEVLGPEAVPIASPANDTSNGMTVGLKVGVGYRLRVSNFPTRTGAVLYPVVEIVGHLHRPPGIDPAKFPIRIIFHPDDVEDIISGGRLVTHYVYLEDPAQALPINLPKDELPTVTVSPAEDPLKVASALGRVMAVIRMGGRTPTPEEISGEPIFDIAGVPCPFSGPNGAKCKMACGPVCGNPPPAGRPWLPKDEYLCDGGDANTPVHFGGDGGLRGIDPRDAVIQFRDDRRPRVLPTNLVCIYAPRFGLIRGSVGPNESRTVDVLHGLELIQRETMHERKEGPRRIVQNESPEQSRHRARLSSMKGRVYAGSHEEVRVLGGIDNIIHLRGHQLIQSIEKANNRQKPGQNRTNIFAQGFRLGESAVVTGIVEGAGEKVMAWKPQEIAGVEVPPNKPGMAVIKRVSTGEAEPGDVVTFSIQYRNMGNVPITSVRVVDSLLPRLEYVPRSAKGPADTVFTAAENKAGAMELRWDIGTLKPGAEGYVSFEAKVR
jgi:uncharacterized repeat protein (TIGR01451 family)